MSKAADLARSGATRMCGDFVLVLMLPDPRLSSIIIAPDTKHGRPHTARVLKRGPGRFTEGEAFVPSELRIDDIVSVDPYRFVTVLGDGQLANVPGTPFAGVGDIAFVRERDVHAVLGMCCRECGTVAKDADPEGVRVGEHYECPNEKCGRLWGYTPTMTYVHPSAEVQQLRIHTAHSSGGSDDDTREVPQLPSIPLRVETLEASSRTVAYAKGTYPNGDSER